jgi:hypothetical protein
MFDTGDLSRLLDDLGKVPGDAFQAATASLDESGEELRATWAANAAATAGEHGKHYPKSITAEPKGNPGLGSSSIGVEVGPDSSMPQGGMGRGFEFGSANQPPHLDGTRALDVVEPKAVKGLADAVGDVMGRLL